MASNDGSVLDKKKPKDYQQVRLTLHMGSKEKGGTRLSLWKRAAGKVHNTDLLLQEWIRNACDKEARRVLDIKK